MIPMQKCSLYLCIALWTFHSPRRNLCDEDQNCKPVAVQSHTKMLFFTPTSQTAGGSVPAVSDKSHYPIAEGRSCHKLGEKFAHRQHERQSTGWTPAFRPNARSYMPQSKCLLDSKIISLNRNRLTRWVKSPVEIPWQ
jgi:hypothetical protein